MLPVALRTGGRDQSATDGAEGSANADRSLTSDLSVVGVIEYRGPVGGEWMGVSREEWPLGNHWTSLGLVNMRRPTAGSMCSGGRRDWPSSPVTCSLAVALINCRNATIICSPVCKSAATSVLSEPWPAEVLAAHSGLSWRRRRPNRPLLRRQSLQTGFALSQGASGACGTPSFLPHQPTRGVPRPHGRRLPSGGPPRHCRLSFLLTVTS